MTQSRTRAVRAAVAQDPRHGAVMPPLVLSSNFTFESFGSKRAYDYTRSGNPTRDDLAQALSSLEGGAGGAVTSSGMSAIALVLQRLGPADRLVAPHDCYGGTYRLMRALADRGQFHVDFVNLTETSAVDRVRSLSPTVVWIETPSNPLLRITDVEAVSTAAHEVGARVVVDNTFSTPVWLQPFALGADIVVHSTTKYLNGHSDVVGGAALGRTDEIAEELCWWANCLGVTGSPFDSYLTLRGLRTLHARLAQHEQNTEALLDVLVSHPAVAAVHHPSLETHPGHAVARRQQRGFGAMLSFELVDGEGAARAFAEKTQLFTLAESLGGVESLVAHPATMTHAAMDAQARQTAGIGDGLLRLSVGIEDPEDLVADLRSTLDAVAGARPLRLRVPADSEPPPSRETKTPSSAKTPG